MNQKILTTASVILVAATAYSFYHSWNCDRDYCLFCQCANGLALLTGIIVGITVVAYKI